jgi:P-type E1-E2 ATPase
MALELRTGQHVIAEISFADVIKEDAKRLLAGLQQSGMSVSIYTGDSQARADKLRQNLDLNIEVVAECTPAQKQAGINTYRQAGHVTAMIGDGINDAPALAFADVGMAFSHDAQTATSEAADIVFLSSSASLIQSTFSIARQTVSIALQSIWVGIGLSIGGMVLASFGLIPPLIGSVIQEVIDVAVILNALRASRLR